jgi:hypothetical protein
VGDVGERGSKSGGEQEADRRAHPGRHRLCTESIAERHHHEHHGEGADDGDREWRRPMEDCGYDELHDDREARNDSHQSPQAVQSAGEQQEHDESDREPEHRRAPIEVGERVAAAARRRARPGWQRVLVDANPVALRDVQRADRSDCRQEGSSSLVRAAQELGVDDPARVGCGQLAGNRFDTLGHSADRVNRAEAAGLLEAPVWPQEDDSHER